MSLDDRLRGTYRRQLNDVHRQLERQPASPTPGPRFGSAYRSARVALATVALVTVLGGLMLALARGDDEPVSIRTEAADQAESELGDGLPSPTVSVSPPTTVPSVTVPPVDSSVNSSGNSSGTSSGNSSGTSSGNSSDETSSGTSSAATDTGAMTTTETVPTTADPTSTTAGSVTSTTTEGAIPVSPVGGIENTVCPSGFRAELERAALAYTGQNRGWGRSDDLVDEQDGPYYFMAWEPNYEEPVTVEVLLADPVVALDIRVAQDPFTPVSGAVSFEAAGQQFDIALSGTDGWRVHRFDEPTTLDRFTISRDAIGENIMEVLVCVEGSP